jgi:hypothetical protein
MPRMNMITIAVLTGVLGCSADSPNSDDAKKLDAQAKADLQEKTDASKERQEKADAAKAGRAAKTEAKANAKAEAKPEPPVADAKALDTNAQDTNTPKNDTAGEIPPDSMAPTARPKDVPEDWQRVTGDVWSFWVPKDWAVTDVKSDDGSGKGDKSARRSRTESGVAVSDLSCTMRSDPTMPTKPAAMKVEAMDRAKKNAKGQKVKAAIMKVELDAGPQDVLHVEYAATGDGTLAIERWVVSARPLGLMCSDESGTKDPANRKILDTALDSLRWVVGE